MERRSDSPLQVYCSFDQHISLIDSHLITYNFYIFAQEVNQADWYGLCAHYTALRHCPEIRQNYTNPGLSYRIFSLLVNRWANRWSINRSTKWYVNYFITAWLSADIAQASVEICQRFFLDLCMSEHERRGPQFPIDCSGGWKVLVAWKLRTSKYRSGVCLMVALNVNKRREGSHVLRSKKRFKGWSVLYVPIRSDVWAKQLFCHTVRVNVRSRVQKFSAWDSKAAPNGKLLWGICSAIYGEVNVSVEKCVEIQGDYVEK